MWDFCNALIGHVFFLRHAGDDEGAKHGQRIGHRRWLCPVERDIIDSNITPVGA